MDFLTSLTDIASTASGKPALIEGLFALILAFVLGQLAAWVYIYTHTGLSYSRSFVQSIVLLTVIISMAMMVIGTNIVFAFGMMGALTVIRFRNVLKDTRDTAFVFFALIIGMATGTFSFPLAIAGAIVYSVVVLYLYWTAFGSRHAADGFVRLQIDVGQIGLTTLEDTIKRYALQIQLTSQRFLDSGDGEVAYRLTMRDPSHSDEMVKELEAIDGISAITFVLHEEQAEV